MALAADDHHRDIAEVHRRLQELAITRKADDAVELMVKHIERAPRQLIAYAREHGVDGLHRPPTTASQGEHRGLIGRGRRGLPGIPVEVRVRVSP
ncbi:hypothetical protein ACFWAY_43080 [Rhodococcus sp. NPDC059968]|uniref:hypothetical protein n=1 Tax=Rhodococcus sp. NPDC059968 TaxID=3347017 RepID=UPI003671B2D4